MATIELSNPTVSINAQPHPAGGHNVDRMTLGEATELLTMPPWGCACTGPWPPPCNCQRAFTEARELHRAAHIVAKLIVTHSDRVDGT